MSEKLIFLDIDGVLHTDRQNRINRGRARPFDPEAISALNRILNETGAKIVISSMWRHYYKTPALFDEMLVDQGLPAGSVVGFTPDLGRDHSYNSTYERGDEILAYCGSLDYRVRIAVIDDMNDMSDLPDECFFQTTTQTGLTEAIADKIIRYLNDEEK